MNTAKRHFQRALLGTLCTALLLTGCASRESKKPALTAPPVRATAATQQTEPATARAILDKMARYLANTPRFSVVVTGQFDVLQDTGQMIEFADTRRLTVQRPDRFRQIVEQGLDERHIVLYDGKDITVFDPNHKVYAQASKTGGIDAAVRYFLRDLRMRMPLALLLTSDLPSQLDARTGTLEYVEKTKIDGQTAHHLAGRSDTVDYQFWIAEGPQPLPLRLVLTYKTAEGNPQFRAQLAHWNLSPNLSANEFSFKAPEGARKIAFLAELADLQPQDGVSMNTVGGEQ